MGKKIKTRKGNYGFDYHYTSPNLVIDENGKSNTTKFKEIDSQFKNIILIKFKQYKSRLISALF